MARKVVDEFIVPKCTGKAFIVKKSQVLRIIEIRGRQVADVMFLNAHNHKEQFAARHSVMLESLQGKKERLKKLDKLYSRPPWENVMLTILEDKVGENCFGGHCSERCYEFLFKAGFVDDPKHRSCSDNFSDCIKDYGMQLEDLDSAGVFNVFMWERVDEQGTLHVGESPTRDGDYIDFLAEMDVLVVFSACPSPPPTNDEVPKDMRVQIFE